MQVNLNFDTEKENLENLKKLVEALQQLISSREGKPYQAPQAAIVQTAPQQHQQAPPSQTGGGCRVIPYEDMSGKMANIFSGRRI